jgi:hypothetical protein
LTQRFDLPIATSNLSMSFTITRLYCSRIEYLDSRAYINPGKYVENTKARALLHEPLITDIPAANILEYCPVNVG